MGNPPLLTTNPSEDLTGKGTGLQVPAIELQSQTVSQSSICAGLSMAQLVAVEGRSIVLGGADIVDGSPVLDIKPYVPFCDSLKDASAPSWVILPHL